LESDPVCTLNPYILEPGAGKRDITAIRSEIIASRADAAWVEAEAPAEKPRRRPKS
jgi:hypothetical protein